MKNRLTMQATIIIIILCIPGMVFAQDECKSLTQPRTITEYLEERICVNLMGRVDQTDPTKQAGPPAAAANSTSLVEKSSAPDLLGFGLDLLKLSDAGGADKKSATPKTLTFSVYALKSAMSGQDPLDPEIYNKNRQARSVSFTVGYEVPENTDDRDPIVGIKWLAFNGRDLSQKKNQDELDKILPALNKSAVGFSVIRAKAVDYIFSLLVLRANLPTGVTLTDREAFDKKTIVKGALFESILSSLTDDEKKRIDVIVATRISDFATLDATTRNAVAAIRTRPQLALAFTTTQRKGGRPDEYSGTLTFDKGMGTNMISMNGSFIFKRNGLGEDTSGGKFAAAFHLPLSGFKPLDYKDPMLFSIEGDATGMTKTAPIYKAQAKLTIPIMAGMEIPISVSVANRTEFVKEKEVKGKFGFTFDVSKALKAFRDSFLKIE